MRNLSYENEFCTQFHLHANQSHFHKNVFALSLALKQRHEGTRKWPIKLIARKAANARKNKMAGSSGESDDILIQSLKENALSKNTLQSTNNWISLRLLKRVLTKALKSMNRRP